MKGAGKTLAEQKVWKFMQDEPRSFDVVALLPGTVYGPPMQVVNSFDELDAASASMLHYQHGKDK